MSLVSSHQPDPNFAGQIVLDALVNTLIPGDPWDKIRKDLTERAEVGKKRYGNYLTTHNGRNALIDLYQELLDAIMYTTQAYLETPDVVQKGWLIDMLRVLLEQAYGVRQHITLILGVDLDGDASSNED